MILWWCARLWTLDSRPSLVYIILASRDGFVVVRSTLDPPFYIIALGDGFVVSHTSLPGAKMMPDSCFDRNKVIAEYFQQALV